MHSFAGNSVSGFHRPSLSLSDQFTDSAAHLIKTLNSRNFLVAIHRAVIESLPTHQHNNFIVLDLACENAKQLLEPVKVEVLFIKRIFDVSGNCFQRSRLFCAMWKSYTTVWLSQVLNGDPTYALNEQCWTDWNSCDKKNKSSSSMISKFWDWTRDLKFS